MLLSKDAIATRVVQIWYFGLIFEAYFFLHNKLGSQFIRLFLQPLKSNLPLLFCFNASSVAKLSA